MAEGGFLHDAPIYLAAAVICVPLAKRVGLGSVLGYLIAGMLIGPFGIGLITGVQSTMHFAEFGVVLMLFLIGLELDLKRLAQMRRPVFGGGRAQWLASGVVLALGLSWQAALVAGLAAAMSSTAIAIQVMSERNLMPTPVGRTGFAILLFQDLAAIPLIALAPVLGVAAPGALPGWQKALYGLAAIAAVFVAGLWVVPPIMRLIAKSDVREIFTASRCCR